MPPRRRRGERRGGGGRGPRPGGRHQTRLSSQNTTAYLGITIARDNAAGWSLRAPPTSAPTTSFGGRRVARLRRGAGIRQGAGLSIRPPPIASGRSEPSKRRARPVRPDRGGGAVAVAQAAVPLVHAPASGAGGGGRRWRRRLGLPPTRRSPTAATTRANGGTLGGRLAFARTRTRRRPAGRMRRPWFGAGAAGERGRRRRDPRAAGDDPRALRVRGARRARGRAEDPSGTLGDRSPPRGIASCRARDGEQLGAGRFRLGTTRRGTTAPPAASPGASRRGPARARPRVPATFVRFGARALEKCVGVPRASAPDVLARARVAATGPASGWSSTICPRRSSLGSLAHDGRHRGRHRRGAVRSRGRRREGGATDRFHRSAPRDAPPAHPRAWTRC